MQTTPTLGRGNVQHEFSLDGISPPPIVRLMPTVSPPAVTAKARLRRIAAAVRAERLKRGLSVTKFAALIGCSFQMLYHIEAAEFFPGMERYLVMCERLGKRRPPLT